METPIFFAVQSNSSAVVEELLKAGADLNSPKSVPPLHIAAYHNCLGIMDLLISSRANLDATRPDLGVPWTAMTAALDKMPPSMEAVHKLLAAGADVNAGERIFPLEYVVINNNREATKLLLRAGADPCHEDETDKSGGATRTMQRISVAVFAARRLDPNLSEKNKAAWDMVAALVAAGNRCWNLLSTPSPRLERALPAVLCTSPQDLPELFEHLDSDVKARIRCTLLLLKRYVPEKRLRGRILTATLTDEGEALPLEEWLPDSILDRIRQLDI